MPDEDRFEVDPTTPLGQAIRRAHEAFHRRDVSGTDAAYREAVRLAAGDPASVALDHVARLWRLDACDLALRRCSAYLATVEGRQRVRFLLLRSEIRCTVGRHRGAAEDAEAIRTALDGAIALTDGERARLLRVEGVAAADRGDPDAARRLLDEAQRIFRAIGDRDGASIIDDDRRKLAVWRGEERADRPPLTAADELEHAVALKNQQHYEEALDVLRRLLEHADDALRPTVLFECVVLARLTRQYELADEFLARLREAAAASTDPETKELAARLSAGALVSLSSSLRVGQLVQHARRLVIDTRLNDPEFPTEPGDPAVTPRLDEAERLLTGLHPQLAGDTDIAIWQLAVGELALARHEHSRVRSFLEPAARHLSAAADRATLAPLAEIRVLALNALGWALAKLGKGEQATDRWAEAHTIEEHIARLQPSDDIRIRMLLAARDEHDERIRAAAAMQRERGEEATAAIVVAMEAARGTTILNAILPRQADLARDLPRLGDTAGAWRWVDGMTRDLPRTQAIWIMHAVPGRIHHAVIGRGLLCHTSAPVDLDELNRTIDRLRSYYYPEFVLEQSIDPDLEDEFGQCLGRLADQVRVDAILPELPRHINRLVTVAGWELSDIPFAALVIPGTAQRIGARFALSDLPCVSARRPLRHRSRHCRGNRRLLVSPPDGLVHAARRSDRNDLLDDQATPEGLRARLASRRHALVRIDSHGRYDGQDSLRASWLQLAPPNEPAGRLSPELLGRLELRGCATLVLGACESGMAKRRGRDERVGFVRSALHAGAGAVVAARWIAEDRVGAFVLDRFERYLRYLPRDVALQRAQLDVYQRVPDHLAGLPHADHPARWACWTLYGDSGYQVRPGRRLIGSLSK